MAVDFERLYLHMARMRFFEEALAGLWRRGLISGEMHLGIGEEGVVVAVLDHLRDGDGLALDHRSTPPLVERGVDPASLFLEMLGNEEGLCKGWGGHMHLFSRRHLAASSGIVGSSGPRAAGFGLAAQHLRPGAVAFAFFGDGAANQGMLLESLNLAVAWRLPVIFVCKDNHWAITTRTRAVTGGNLVRRARSFGMPARCVNGARVETIWPAAASAVGRARKGKGPSFILARCSRLEGHFLGDPLIRVLDEPVKQTMEISPPLTRALVCKQGAPMLQRLAGMGKIGGALCSVATEIYLRRRDPLRAAAVHIPEESRLALEEEAHREVEAALEKALEIARVERSA